MGWIKYLDKLHAGRIYCLANKSRISNLAIFITVQSIAHPTNNFVRRFLSSKKKNSTQHKFSFQLNSFTNFLFDIKKLLFVKTARCSLVKREREMKAECKIRFYGFSFDFLETCCLRFSRCSDKFFPNLGLFLLLRREHVMVISLIFSFFVDFFISNHA